MRIPEHVEIYESTSIVYWIDGGIVYLNARNEPPLNLDAAARDIVLLRERMENRKMPAIMDISARSKSSPREIRVYTRKMLPELFTAMAFVATTAVGRMMAHVFLGLQPMPFPTKVFPDGAAARQWLRKLS